MAFRDADQLISPFSQQDRKKPSSRKGWGAYKTRITPEAEIWRVWGPTRCLHHLKANTSDFYVGDEHVAHVRWRVFEHWTTIKKPPAGYVRPVDLTKMEAARRMAAEAARKRAEREAAAGYGRESSLSQAVPRSCS
ncbi:hypothetical protein JYU29_05970 [Tianweitania sp. BSSL-BM11]|uniref:Uncharacterized protein n=1 Tax=Tianweitania aestuarii TaxID=2814886 RepID=A0ABS5RT43_9HYPH|nr:hypothetical protein [Tianweitania aestuarii]MBS9720231.1 hypothetical protein [Tianweitania aestuarii]